MRTLDWIRQPRLPSSEPRAPEADIGTYPPSYNLILDGTKPIGLITVTKHMLEHIGGRSVNPAGNADVRVPGATSQP